MHPGLDVGKFALPFVNVRANYIEVAAAHGRRAISRSSGRVDKVSGENVA